MSAKRRASSQPAAVAFNPVYQSSEGGILPLAADSAAAAADSAADSRGSDTNSFGGAVTREQLGRKQQGGEGVSGVVVAPGVRRGEGLGSPAGIAEGGSEDSDDDDHDDDEDDDVDWEEQEVVREDGGGVLGAGRQAVVDSDGDEGALKGSRQPQSKHIEHKEASKQTQLTSSHASKQTSKQNKQTT